MEVFFVVSKTSSNQVIYGVDLLELDGVLMTDPDDLEDILLHDLIVVNWLLALLVVDLLES